MFSILLIYSTEPDTCPAPSKWGPPGAQLGWIASFGDAPISVGIEYWPIQASSPKQHHLPSLHEITSDEAVEVDAAGNVIAAIILTVPGNVIYALFFYASY